MELPGGRPRKYPKELDDKALVRGADDLENQEAVIEMYGLTGSVSEVSQRLHVPRPFVRQVLEHPDLARRALAMRRGMYAIRFVQEVIPSLLEQAVDARGRNSAQAATLLAKLLSLNVSGEREGSGKDLDEAMAAELPLERRLIEVTAES